jgi:hypothetical protein
VDHIPPVNCDDEVNQVLDTQVEESDVDDNQQESALSLLSHYSDVLWMGSKVYLKLHCWNTKLNCVMICL